MTDDHNTSKLTRIGLEVLGWVLLAGGIAALVLPGPGLLLLAAGLWVLAKNYRWADRLLDPVKRAGYRGAAEGVKTWPRIIGSSALALALIGLGIFWGIGPAAPGWWPLAAKWWLFGGWGTGVFLIVSGLLALVLIGWSIKNFRYGSMTLEEVYASRHLNENPSPRST
ncbi:MAG: PGPGW domain-containing protein [Nakamurella sp.]